MKTILIVIGILLMASQAFAATPTVAYGSATVDGNLSDWAGASWNAFNYNYDNVAIDITDGAWSARWTAGKIYLAVKVQDTAHIFTDTYTDWAARDSVELYLHTTGTVGDYGTWQEPAQQWTVGLKTAADGSVWANADYITPAPYAPTASECLAAGSIDGEWLYYEAAITPYQYFGGKWTANNPGDPKASIVSPLSFGDIIGLDVVACSNNGLLLPSNYGVPGYTGMKCSLLNQSYIGGWSANYSTYAQQQLVPEPGTLMALASGVGALGLLRRRRS